MSKEELIKYLRTQRAFTIAEVQQKFGLNYGMVRQVVKELEDAGSVSLDGDLTFKWVLSQPKKEKRADNSDVTPTLDLLFDDDDEDEDEDEDDEDIFHRITATHFNASGQSVVATNRDTDTELDPFCKRALKFWLTKQGGRASIASIQRNLGIGYNRAGRMMDSLQQLGYIEKLDEYAPSSRPLRVLVTLEEVDKLFPNFPD